MIAFLCGTTPTDVRYPGDRIAIRVNALVPGAAYTVRLARRFRGTGYASFLEARADADGVIDTRRCAALRGTYTGVDPDGLFWSMQPCAHASDELTCWVESAGSVIVTRTLASRKLRPGVRMQTLADDLVGALYLPATAAPRPAVLVLGGSDGGIEGSADYAAALANHGFVALALAYFAAPGLPERLAGIPLEYLETAVRFLQRHAAANTRVGVVGRSRGGELALLLGSLSPAVRAVVAHAASPYRWCGTAGPAAPAWTYRGAVLPYLAPSGAADVEVLPDGRVFVATAPMFEASLRASHVADARCDLAATRGPVLLLSGDDDQVWPSRLLAEHAMARLGRQGDVWISYADAGHGATLLPGDPTTERAIHHPVGGMWLVQGGTPEGNARSRTEAWTEVLGFLERHLATNDVASQVVPGVDRLPARAVRRP